MGKAEKTGGRPTKMTKATLGKLREAFLFGATDREACVYADIHPDTLYAFQEENPEYSEQKEVWKMNPIIKARKTVFDNLHKSKNARWFLEKRMRKEFGNKDVVDADGPKTIADLVAEMGYVDGGK